MYKYDLYHHDQDNDTKKCMQVHDKIQELIHYGRLDRFFQDWREKQDALEDLACLLEPPLRLEEPVN